MDMSYVQNKLQNLTNPSNQLPSIPQDLPVEADQHRTPDSQYQPDTPKISKKSDGSSSSSEIQSQVQYYAHVSESREKTHIEAVSSPGRLVNRSVDSGANSNLGRYLKWLEESANEGIALAQFSLAEMYSKGQGVPQDWKRATAWFLKAAQGGDPLAQQDIGCMYLHGIGVDRDFKQAFDWLSKAAGQGYAPAQYGLGRMYFHGIGVDRDFKQAFDWYSKAAGQGYAPAQHALGLMYFHGQGVDRDVKQAFEWVSKAAAQGHSAAKHELGLMYFLGQGVDRDFKQAFDWLSKAAEQGFGPAQYELGLMYFYGHGNKQDRKKAMEWHLKAAAQGNDKARYHLGMMYFSETGVDIAFEKAIEWIVQAAENGKKDAQSKLVEIYSTDLAGRKDLKLATYWALKHGKVESGKEIQVSKISATEILNFMPDVLNKSHEFKSVQKLKLNEFGFNRNSLSGLSHLIKFGTGLNSIVINVDNPSRKGFGKSVRKLADLIREENTWLTEFTLEGKKMNAAVKLQISQILEQNSRIGELRWYMENHRPAISDELPLEVLEHQADQLIIHNIRRGQTMEFTKAAIDEFLISAQYHKMLENTVQVSRPPVLLKNTAQ
jgi:TPR repeat protein